LPIISHRGQEGYYPSTLVAAELLHRTAPAAAASFSSSVYIRVGENMDAARREVGENISLAHLLLFLPTYLPTLFQHLLFVAKGL